MCEETVFWDLNYAMKYKSLVSENILAKVLKVKYFLFVWNQLFVFLPDKSTARASHMALISIVIQKYQLWIAFFISVLKSRDFYSYDFMTSLVD